MSKFTHAGVSRHKGQFKVRFATDAARVKILAKNGHKDIDVIELPNAMTKVEICDYLLSINFDNGNAEVRAALEAAQTKRAPESGNKDRPGKEKKKPKQNKPKKATSLEEIAARAHDEVVEEEAA
jgi:hypothetical protein